MATSTPIVNEALAYILVFSFLLFFAIVFLMVYFVVRYRRTRSPVASPISGNLALEVLWIVLPTLLVLTMFYYGLTGFTFLRTVPEGSFKVTAVARQWSWLFQYENGKTSKDLVVPVGKPVDVTLTSQDVIHSFFIPAFRVKEDCVPGMKTRAWFKTTQAGSWDIMCAEYCGLLHSRMLSRVLAVPQGDFDKWYAGESSEVTGSAGKVLTEGEKVLQDKGCLGCHSLDGSIGAGPTFKGLYGSAVEVVTAGRQRAVTADAAYIESAISEPGKDIASGFPNVMPTYKATVNAPEMHEIIEFLKTLK
jgi:cytochrome c oxidase subunit II